jgi:hypothetical protein
MIMFHVDPLIRRISKIIDCVVRAGPYKYRTYLRIHIKIMFRYDS